jgi:hypothetical protein
MKRGKGACAGFFARARRDGAAILCQRRRRAPVHWDFFSEPRLPNELIRTAAEVYIRFRPERPRFARLLRGPSARG